MNRYTENYTTANLLNKLIFHPRVMLDVRAMLHRIDPFKGRAPIKKDNYWGVAPVNRVPSFKYADVYTRSKGEVRSYYDALDYYLNNPFELNETTIKDIHKRLFAHDKKNDHAGGYKRKNIAMHLSDPISGAKDYIKVSAANSIPEHMGKLIAWYRNAIANKPTHPLLIIYLFIYEFLAIHPFEDGNGRASRVLAYFLLIQAGYDFMKYGSLEKAIERDRAEYIKTLYHGTKDRGTDFERVGRSLVFFLHSIEDIISEVFVTQTRVKGYKFM